MVASPPKTNALLLRALPLRRPRHPSRVACADSSLEAVASAHDEALPGRFDAAGDPRVDVHLERSAQVAELPEPLEDQEGHEFLEGVLPLEDLLEEGLDLLL